MVHHINSFSVKFLRSRWSSVALVIVGLAETEICDSAFNFTRNRHLGVSLFQPPTALTFALVANIDLHRRMCVFLDIALVHLTDRLQDHLQIKLE